MEHARTHGRLCAVEHIEQRLAFLALCSRQFEVAYREAVEPHVALLFYAAKVLDMCGLQVLRHVQIVEYAAGGNHRIGHLLQPEAFQVLHAPLLLQPLHRTCLVEHPVL